MATLHRAQLKLGTIAIVTLLVLLVALRVTGVFAIGYVPTDSMDPTLPSGSLFLSLPLESKEGSIVVFTLPTGERIVHRVAAVEEGGLVTKGDNNRVSDQAQGWDLVDPDQVQVVPQPGGRPLAVKSPIENILTIVLIQLALFAVALYGSLKKSARPSRLRPHHLLVFAAVGLMVAAPVFEKQYDGEDLLIVESSFLPVVVHAKAEDKEETWTLGPFSSQETDLTGPVDVTIAPAFPGMKFLVPSGPLVAYAPLSLSLVAAAWGFRRMGA